MYAIRSYYVEELSRCHLPTEYGDFELVTFRDTIDDQLHFALVKDAINPEQPTLVRVHLNDFFSDVLLTDRHAVRSWPIPEAMRRIGAEGGVLVILGQQNSQAELLARVQHFAAEDKGELPPTAKWTGTSRRVGAGSQILKALGVTKMRLLSSPKKYHALSGFGLEVVEYIAD